MVVLSICQCVFGYKICNFSSLKGGYKIEFTIVSGAGADTHTGVFFDV